MKPASPVEVVPGKKKIRKNRGRLFGFVLTCEFPCLRIFPRDINRMVEVEEQAFAAIEKSEAEKIVVDECRERAQDDVEEAEATLALGNRHVCAEGGVAVHVVNVVGEGGVRVVENGVFESA